LHLLCVFSHELCQLPFAKCRPRFSVCLNGPEARIGGDHLPDLIRQFLPVANEVARVIVRHCLHAFFFQNGNHRQSIRAILYGLTGGCREKGAGNPLEFAFDPRPDLPGPFDLARSTGNGALPACYAAVIKKN
jgi:hypothetical protein